MNHLGFVAIGRNEGERLRRCLASLRKTGAAVVYVDSGSSDGSVQQARAMGVEVVELDLSIPFNASRARNAGWRRLVEILPAAQFVHFIDGDCTLADGWLEAALAELEKRKDCAVTFGRRRELHPEASIYNQFCDVEWNGATGEVQSCGGDALMRLAVLQEAAGFDVTVPAGEEPELCARVRKNGWKIISLPQDMTWHDAAMNRFGQWWRRQFRTGYNGLDVAQRFGLPHFQKISRSARIWTLGVAALLLAIIFLAAWRMSWPTLLLGILFLSMILLAQSFRIGRHRGGMVYGMMSLLSKWGQLAGQIQYYRDRRRGESGRLIEYKNSENSQDLVAASMLSKERN